MKVYSRFPGVFLWVSFVLAALSGCGSVIDLGGSTPPANIFKLEPLNAQVAETPVPDWRLRIAPPTASGGLDTDRIAVATAPLEIRYYAEARWADRVPEMVQALLVDSFETGADAVALTVDSTVGTTPYILETDIREFQADVTDEAAPQAKVRIALRLMRPGPTRLVANTTLNATAEADGTEAAALVRAFNTAMQDLLAEAVEWTAAQVRKAGPA